MKKYIWIMLFAGVLVSCSEEGEGTTPTPGRKPVWEEYTHAQLLRLQGAVRSVREYITEDEMTMDMLTASFDAAGHCTSYNPTGIDPDMVTYEWGQEAVWYDYKYDASGRMSEVTRYEVGADPLVYTITYGSHSSYIPAPFPLGDIQPLMLRGVTRIQATGYLLTADEQGATIEEQTGGWFSYEIATSVAIAEGMPVRSESVWTQRGEVVRNIEITYTYRDNWLSEVRSVTRIPEEDDQIETTGYSSLWPCSPEYRQTVQGDVTQRIEYSYTENGLPKKAQCTEGTLLDPSQTFERWYNSYDAQRNWISSTKDTEGMELIYSREVLYY